MSPGNGDIATEKVRRLAVFGGKLGLFSPIAATVIGEDICGAGVASADDEEIACNCHARAETVGVGGVRGFELGLLVPGAVAGVDEDVSRAGVAAIVAVSTRADDHRSPGHGHAEAELVGRATVIGCEFGLLAPATTAVVHEDVGGAGIRAITVVTPGADDGAVAAERNAGAETIADVGIVGSQFGLLAPAVAVAHENVGGAGVVAVLVFEPGADDGGVGVECDAAAEQIAGLCVVAGELGLLAPVVVAVTDEDVHRAGVAAVVVVEQRADKRGVRFEINGEAEAIVGSAVIGEQFLLLGRAGADAAGSGQRQPQPAMEPR